MLKYLFLIAVFTYASCSTTYYVVRHAEKQTATSNMSSDVPLSEEGTARALALKDALDNKRIKAIYSTNYIRTKSTAQPLSDAIGVPVQTYNPADTLFIKQLKNNNKKNTLIVGHSNTVDNIVNQLTGTEALTDLPETQYGDLFIIRKKGAGYTVTKERFGN